MHHNSTDSIVSIMLPDLDEVRQSAHTSHLRRRAWHGVASGGQAEYNPSRPKSPLDSTMTFTPADLCSGESKIWFYSMMWEHGIESPPVDLIDDQAIIGVVAP